MTARERLRGEIRNSKHMRDRELVLRQQAITPHEREERLREIAYLDEQICWREAELTKQQGADVS